MDGFGTILGLLILLVPLAAKLIEKALASAGNQDTARKIKEFRELFEDNDGEDAEEENDEPTVFREVFPDAGFDGNTILPAPAESVVSEMPVNEKQSGMSIERRADVPAELMEGGYRSVKDIINDRRKAAKSAGKVSGFGEAACADSKTKLEIDPKKLVIYSEIMKPKF